MQMQIDTESWAYKVSFRVSRGAESALDVVVVTLTDAHGHVGRGEAAGVDYDGETVALLCAAQLWQEKPLNGRTVAVAQRDGASPMKVVRLSATMKMPPISYLHQPLLVGWWDLQRAG